MMDQRIRELLDGIHALEAELRTALHARESHASYRLHDGRIEFAKGVKAMHRRVRRSVMRWIVTDRPQNFLTGPIIYGLAIPLLLLDLVVTVYQALCFPVYRIAKVRRADYVVFDRHKLGYLNIVERFHCEYCAYANGLLAYVTEITARTEQYFCPIKHARKILGTHARYTQFIDFGDGEDFHRRLEQYRRSLGKEPDGGESAVRPGPPPG